MIEKIPGVVRRSRFDSALRKTRHSVVGEPIRDHRGEWPSPDREFAKELGLYVKENRRSSCVHCVSCSRPQFRMVVPPKRYGLVWFALRNKIDCSGPEGPSPDWAIQEISTKRTVFRHSFADRIIHRMFLGTLEPMVESVLTDAAHAYRPGRSRWTALLRARTYLRAGFRFVLPLDIRGFFTAIRVDLVRTLLGMEFPHACKAITETVLTYLQPLVWFPDEVKLRRLPHLLTGSPLAPVVSNLVGHHFVDRPIRELLGNEVVLVRYADDILILARDPFRADQARDVVAALLGIADLDLHEENLVQDPIDVYETPVTWLGKILHGGQVRTPQLRRKVDDLMTHLGPSRLEKCFFSAANNLRNELTLDSASSRNYVLRELGRRCRGVRLIVETAWDSRGAHQSSQPFLPSEVMAEE